MTSTHLPPFASGAHQDAALHPLEPLAAEEITSAVAILRREQELAETVRFSTVELREPTKEEVLGWPETGSPAREAFIILWDRADGAVHEAVVSLNAEEVVQWRHVPGVQPRIVGEEFVECEEIGAARRPWSDAPAAAGRQLHPS